MAQIKVDPQTRQNGKLCGILSAVHWKMHAIYAIHHFLTFKSNLLILGFSHGYKTDADGWTRLAAGF